MERSRLPLPPLLGLFGALLILSPELPLGTAKKISDPPVTDPGVQEALAFAMEQYNKDTGGSANYFKLLHLVKVVREEDALDIYHLTVLLGETRCEKRAGNIMRYKNIRECPLLPGNPKKLTCYFGPYWRQYRMLGMTLGAASCTPSLPPKELFCSSNGA